MGSDSTLTVARLREYLHYDSDAGTFTRHADGKVLPGSRAGRGGRRQLCIDGRMYYVHRLAWLYVYGRWPDRMIDHVNGDVDDNRLVNLREATSSENAQNKRLTSQNKSGFCGVAFDDRKGSKNWRARIMLDGRSVSLGYFYTREEAAQAYRAAKQVMHPFWARR